MAPQVSFNWDIHLDCNYRCPYCWFDGKWDELKTKNFYPGKDALMKAWRLIYDKYGKVKIAVTGGEPLTYPGFAEFISEISGLHELMVITNLSADVNELIDPKKRDRVCINPSFHPLAADVDAFINKALMLKEAGLMKCITFLAWPPLIGKLSFYRELFEKNGLSLTVQSFFGTYEGRRYPESYSEQEKAAIFPHLGNRGGEYFQTEAFDPRGKLCNAGRIYGVISPDGSVRRCGGSNSSKSILGNIFSGDFKLLKEPAQCDSEVCPCNEWAFLLEKNDIVTTI
ncbi:MAG: radical SAM protein [Endomicrobiales bacterium]|nr:radical SAM protein [Endomicrobiales bacterium]